MMPLLIVLPLLVIVSAVLTDWLLSETCRLLHPSFVAIFLVVPEILLELLKLVVIFFGLSLVGQLFDLFFVVLFHLQKGVIELLLQLYLFLVESGSDQFFLQFQLIMNIAFVLIYETLLILYHDLQLDYFLVFLCSFLQ